MAAKKSPADTGSTTPEKPKRNRTKKAEAALSVDAGATAPLVGVSTLEIVEVAAPAAVEPAPGPAAPTHAEIARAAYELWLARGGTALQNWLEAERRLRG